MSLIDLVGISVNDVFVGLKIKPFTLICVRFECDNTEHDFNWCNFCLFCFAFVVTSFYTHFISLHHLVSLKCKIFVHAMKCLPTLIQNVFNIHHSSNSFGQVLLVFVIIFVGVVYFIIASGYICFARNLLGNFGKLNRICFLLRIRHIWNCY